MQDASGRAAESTKTPGATSDAGHYRNLDNSKSDPSHWHRSTRAGGLGRNPAPRSASEGAQVTAPTRAAGPAGNRPSSGLAAGGCPAPPSFREMAAFAARARAAAIHKPTSRNAGWWRISP